MFYCHRSFNSRFFIDTCSPHGRCKNKTALAQKYLCARADKNLWCHLACRTITAQPLCREPTFPCPVTGATRQRILKACACFPVPSVNHYAAPLCTPFPAKGLSVTALGALLSLHWFKAFIPQRTRFVNGFLKVFAKKPKITRCIAIINCR